MKKICELKLGDEVHILVNNNSWASYKFVRFIKNNVTLAIVIDGNNAKCTMSIPLRSVDLTKPAANISTWKNIKHLTTDKNIFSTHWVITSRIFL